MRKASCLPDTKDAQFVALTAKFDDLKRRSAETSDINEREALVEEIQSLLFNADIIIQEHVDMTSGHLERIARKYEGHEKTR